MMCVKRNKYMKMSVGVHIYIFVCACVCVCVYTHKPADGDVHRDIAARVIIAIITTNVHVSVCVRIINLFLSV